MAPNRNKAFRIGFTVIRISWARSRVVCRIDRIGDAASRKMTVRNRKKTHLYPSYSLLLLQERGTGFNGRKKGGRHDDGTLLRQSSLELMVCPLTERAHRVMVAESEQCVDVGRDFFL